MRQSIWALAALGAFGLSAPAAAGITSFTLTATGTLTSTQVGCTPEAGLDPCPFTPIPVDVPLAAEFAIHFDTPLALTGTHNIFLRMVDWQWPQTGTERNQGYVDTLDRYDSWDGWYSYDSSILGGSRAYITITDGQLTSFRAASTLSVTPQDAPCRITEFAAANGAFQFELVQRCFFLGLQLQGEGSYDVTMHHEPAPGPSPAIPEPATWAMLIAGFGLIGASLRRRAIRLQSRQ